MTLINNNNAQIGIRQIKGRTSADNYLGTILHYCLPGIGPLFIAEIGMPLCRHYAETAFKTGQPLRCQRNFRHHDQRLFSLLQRLSHRLKINFGFARAGNPVQQGNRKTLTDLRGQNIGSGSLLRRQPHFMMSRIRQRKFFLLFNGNRRQNAFFNQRINHPDRYPGAFANFGFGIRGMLQQIHNPPPGVGIFDFGFRQRLAGKGI